MVATAQGPILFDDAAFEGERFKLPVVGEWAAEQADGPA